MCVKLYIILQLRINRTDYDIDTKINMAVITIKALFLVHMTPARSGCLTMMYLYIVTVTNIQDEASCK